MPHLLDVEVAHVIRRHAAGGEIVPERGHELLRDLVDIPMQRHPHDWLLLRVWALRSNLTACDALYIALAEALEAPHPAIKRGSSWCDVRRMPRRGLRVAALSWTS